MHVPFCERLCPYCDFAVTVSLEIPHDEYGEAILRELTGRQKELAGRTVETLYFGGGTPSLLAPRVLSRIIEKVTALFGVHEVREITIEANPNQITAENLASWKDIGINRLSLGCQSFQPRHLNKLRRNHSADQALQAAHLAIAAFDNVSLDLMFAGPSQTMDEWEKDLAMLPDLVERGLTHLSSYNLTIEEGTAFSIRQKRGTVVVPDDDTAAEMLFRLVEATSGVGLRRYEVSNFARPGCESRHNSLYWRGIPYLGVGVGAHSLELRSPAVAIRRSNPRRLHDYLAAKAPNLELLDAATHFRERLFLGARSIFGVDLTELNAQFGEYIDPVLMRRAGALLDTVVAQGLFERNGQHYFPTNQGLNVSDGLAARFFEI